MLRRLLLAFLTFTLIWAEACSSDDDSSGTFGDDVGGVVDAVGDTTSDTVDTVGDGVSDGVDAGLDAFDPDDERQNADGEGPARVELGSTTNPEAPAAYVLLAETGITNVTGSVITGGHIGVSPEVLATITGFGLTHDATSEFATADAVVAPWRVYASNNASPTPANLTGAIDAMRSAYADAASRTNPDGLNISDGILDGVTFEPGLYTWGSNVTISGDMTVSGGADDVWIFQISGSLVLRANKRVRLAGGAQAKNVFWQVADAVTVESGAHVQGIILGKTGITMQTNASMVGRAFAQSLVAIDDNVITAP